MSAALPKEAEKRPSAQLTTDNTEFSEKLMDKENPGRGRSATEKLIMDDLGGKEEE